MENNTNELQLVTNNNNQVATTNKFADDGFSLAVDMTSAQTQFCSMQPQTDKEKAQMFNAMNNPDKRLADCINMKIKCKDVYVEVVNCTNEETGEATACPRIVLIDDKGVSYQAVSLGIYSAIKKVIQVFGVPTWNDGVTLEVKQVSKGAKKMLTLNVVA